MPRQRMTKEMLLEQAYRLVKEKGMDGLSAQSLASAAQCSVQPIYSYFANMDELKDAMYQKAGREYRVFLNHMVSHIADQHGLPYGLQNRLRYGVCEDSDPMACAPAVFLGKAHITFASRYPHLFFLLFQQTQSVMLESMLPHFGEGQACLEELEQKILEAFPERKGEAAQGFFLFVHGTACVIHAGLAKMDLERLEPFLDRHCRTFLGDALGDRSSSPARHGRENENPAKGVSYGCFRGWSGKEL